MAAKRPLVTITFAFAAGILAAACALPLVWCMLLLLVVLLPLSLLHRQKPGTEQENRGENPSSSLLPLTFSLFLLFALFGSVRYLAGVFVATNDISRLAPRFLTVTGVVASEVTIQTGLSAGSAGQGKSGKFVLEVRQVGSGTGERPVPLSGQVAVRVPLGAKRQLPGEEPESAPLHYGDVLTLRGRLERPQSARNPGGFDYADYLQRRGIYATLLVRRDDDWQPIPQGMASPNPLLSLAFRLRQSLLRHGRAAHPTTQAGVLNGILLGDRGDLPKSLNEDFERTGTSHVLATAGLHVGMVVALLLGFLRFCRIARRPALLLAFLSLVLYALMAGGRPSVTRAVIMASVVLFEPGFQLSFATVITIVLTMPLTEHAIHSAGRWIKDDWPGAKQLHSIVHTIVACFFLAVTAFLGSAPLIAYYYNSISLISVFANTLVVPAIAMIIALGFGAAFLSLIHPLLSLPLDRALDSLLAWVVTIVHACAAPSYASLNVASPSPWFVLAYYILLGSLSGISRQAGKSHLSNDIYRR